MEPLVVASNVVSVLGFATAAVLALTVRPTGRLPNVAKTVFAAAMLLHVFVGVSNVLEHGGVTDALDVYEDFAEILFVPMLAYAACSIGLERRIDEQRRAADSVKAQLDLLLNVLDTTPSGVLMIDASGFIMFANEAAQEGLGLIEDPDTGGWLRPGWRMTDPESGEDAPLRELVGEERHTGVRRAVVWPDGRRTEILLSATPMLDRKGRPGGCVVAFEVVSEGGAA